MGRLPAVRRAGGVTLRLAATRARPCLPSCCGSGSALGRTPKEQQLVSQGGNRVFVADAAVNDAVSLLEQGLITPAEHQAKRQEILNGL